MSKETGSSAVPSERIPVKNSSISKRPLFDDSQIEVVKKWGKGNTIDITTSKARKRVPEIIKKPDGKVKISFPQNATAPEIISVVTALDKTTFAQQPEQQEKRTKRVVTTVQKRTTAIKNYLAPHISILDKKHKPLAENLLKDLNEYTDIFSTTSIQSSEATPLSPEQITQLDEVLGVKKLWKLKNPRQEPTEEELTQTREAMLTQYFNVIEKAEKGNEPHQNAITKTHERYLGTLFEPIKEALNAAIFANGMEALTTLGKNGWNDIARDAMGLTDEQLSLKELIDIPATKEFLDKKRRQAEKKGEISILAYAELEVAQKIQNIVSKLPYEASVYSPEAILQQQQRNCAGASLLGGKLLQEVGIKYLVGYVPGHSMTVLLTSDGKARWFDFLNPKDNKEITNKDLQGSLSVQDIIKYENTPSAKGFMVNDSLMVSSPERGHQAQIFESIADELTLKKKYEEAIIANTNAIALVPNRSAYYANRGICYMYLQDYEKAREDVHKAIKLNPINPFYRINLGSIYLSLGKNEAATAVFHEAGKLTNTLTETKDKEKLAGIYSDLGRIYFDSKNYEEALWSLTIANNLDPFNARYYNSRGCIYDKMDNEEAALNDFRQAVGLDIKELIYWNNLAEFFCKRKEYTQVIEVIMSAHNHADLKNATDSERARLKIYTGDLYFNTTMYRSADEILREAIELDRDEARPYYLLALTQEIRGNHDEVMPLLQKAQGLVDPKEEEELSNDIRQKIDFMTRQSKP